MIDDFVATLINSLAMAFPDNKQSHGLSKTRALLPVGTQGKGIWAWSRMELLVRA